MTHPGETTSGACTLALGVRHGTALVLLPAEAVYQHCSIALHYTKITDITREAIVCNCHHCRMFMACLRAGYIISSYWMLLAFYGIWHPSAQQHRQRLAQQRMSSASGQLLESPTSGRIGKMVNEGERGQCGKLLEMSQPLHTHCS